MDCKRLEAFEMRIWRRMLKISWTEHRTNDEVLQLAQEQRTLMTTLRQRQKNVVGTCVTSRLVTKEGSRRANERKKEAGQAKGNVIILVDEKEYKMDYSQLKRMVENVIEWHR